MKKTSLRIQILSSFIKRILTFFYKILMSKIKELWIWIYETYKSQNYMSIMVVFTFSSLFLTVMLESKSGIINELLKIILSSLQFVIVIAIFIRIIKLKSESTQLEHYEKMIHWSLLTFICITNFILLNTKKIESMYGFINIGAGIVFFMACYYSGRSFLLDRIKTWKAYTGLFFCMPLVASLVSIFFIGFFKSSLDLDLSIVDKYIFGIILLINSILLNMSIAFTPYERLAEVKVAVYLILAVFSALSYCYFISDVLAQIIVENIPYGKLYNITEIKDSIDYSIKFISVPYLIGAVFGCFTIELIDRNYKFERDRKELKINNSDSNDQVS